jgi:hypothetical protein
MLSQYIWFWNVQSFARFLPAGSKDFPEDAGGRDFIA